MTTNPGPYETLLDQLDLDERAALTAGHDDWNTQALPDHGVPAIRVTDGPVGARGESFTSVTAALFPCGSALGATFDPALVGRIGAALGDEARTKHAHVLLGPTLNLHRHPLGGRNFESYGEDPLLVSRLAVVFVRGVQSKGIGACPQAPRGQRRRDRADDHLIGCRRAGAPRGVPPAVRGGRHGGWGVDGHGVVQPDQRDLRLRAPYGPAVDPSTLPTAGAVHAGARPTRRALAPAAEALVLVDAEAAPTDGSRRWRHDVLLDGPSRLDGDPGAAARRLGGHGQQREGYVPRRVEPVRGHRLAQLVRHNGGVDAVRTEGVDPDCLPSNRSPPNGRSR